MKTVLFPAALMLASSLAGGSIDLYENVTEKNRRGVKSGKAFDLRSWRNESVLARGIFADGGGDRDVKLELSVLKAENGAEISSAVEYGQSGVATYFRFAVPGSAAPGRYRGELTAKRGDGSESVYPVNLTVLDRSLAGNATPEGKAGKDIAGLVRLCGFGGAGAKISPARIRWAAQYAAAKGFDGFQRRAESESAGNAGISGFEKAVLLDALEDGRKIRALRACGQSPAALEAALAMYNLRAMERADEESFAEAVSLVGRELDRMDGDGKVSLRLAGWVGGRRALTLDWFRREMYGYAPDRPQDMVFDDKGVTFAGGKMRINIHVSLPKGASKDNPAPVFVMGDHYYRKTSRTKTDVMPNMPTNTVTARGYAYVCVNYNDVALNCYNDEWSNKVHSVYGVGRGDDWGTISAWAWCLSRVMDWIETRPELDSKRVAVTGHSRGGKAALWAGAQDRRFAMVAPNGSGTGGARLLRIDLPKAEPLDWMLGHSIKFWFCPNLRKFRGRTDEIPYDADDLFRLVAPRLAYAASGSGDDWAGPEGEFEAAKRAGDIWELYGKRGIPRETEFPRPGEWLHDNHVGYHLHDGPHALRKWDWERFMDFADRHMRKPGDIPVPALDPIGVFDSGVGGMTVLERLLKMDLYDNETGERKSDGRADFEGERFVYFGDQANMPYGDYAAAGKSDYLKKLIVEDAEFLLAKKAKAVVIACNTATAWGLERVCARTAKENVPTIGVIEAGVASALSLPEIAGAAGNVSIGVMATPGTIASGAYERTILREAKKRGIKARITVVSQGCAGLADAVEAGSPEANGIACRNYVELKAKHAAAEGAGPVKAVILGCTHYPFVLPALERVAAGVKFVDPALSTAEECYLNLRRSGKLRGKGEMSLSAFISVPSPELDRRFLDGSGNLKRSCKYGRELGDKTKWTEVKHYSAIDAANNAFIRESLPVSWNLLYSTTYFPR